MLGLKQIRKARKFNQQKVAMDLNISRASLCHYERGVREPSLEILVRMSEYFGVSIYYLITGRERVPGENKDFTLKTASGPCRISTDKLMYVEVAKHRLYYHLVDDVLEVTGSLSKTEEDLKPYGFLKCNQCYLINPRFIIKIKGMDVQIGNETLAISRPRKKAFLSELAKWYGGF